MPRLGGEGLKGLNSPEHLLFNYFAEYVLYPEMGFLNMRSGIRRYVQHQVAEGSQIASRTPGATGQGRSLHAYVLGGLDRFDHIDRGSGCGNA